MHKHLLENAQYFKIQAANDLKKALEIVKTHFLENSSHITRIQAKFKGLEQS